MKDATSIRHAIGVDFGGTFIKMALVSERGEIKARAKIPTKDAPGLDGWLDAVGRGLEQLKDKKAPADAPLAGIGVGVPGFVDFERGFIYDLANVPGWTNVHLAPRIEERFHLHVRVDNDVNVMALGECTYGAGRAYQHAVFVTLGTGVGGGIVINNQLYRGAYSMAGEIGHVPIRMDGVKSPQGRGGLEQYVGNRRLVERVVQALQQGRASLIRELAQGDLSAITVELIAKAAGQGDALALELFDFMADCLAAAFASVAYLIQPQAFIIGGGIAQSGAILFDPLRRHLTERLSPVFAERIVVKPAELGNDAGVIGAATLSMME
ncbi:MAG TPA: ROK family protein [Kiritimatiellia bacterium]|nr:ROK family protein [Kiritimatiellia bacterium]HRZ13157.1 ROK family protein [Kiritimatiellia bacterium]HSA17578.1 ROK family protein [Kiritimatiellia bacterium]